MSQPPFDDQYGNVTIIGFAIALGWGIVKTVVAIVEWLEGERPLPWKKEV